MRARRGQAMWSHLMEAHSKDVEDLGPLSGWT